MEGTDVVLIILILAGTHYLAAMWGVRVAFKAIEQELTKAADVTEQQARLEELYGKKKK